MRALEELPEHEKDMVLPTVFLRPWLSSNELEKSVERIQKAFGERKFILDIDQYYTANDTLRRSSIDFLRLRASENYEEWLSFVGLFPNVIPSLQLSGLDASKIRHQIEIATSMDRGFLFRIGRNASVRVTDVIAAASTIEHSNYLFSVDPGWSNDLLNHMLWASGTVRSIGEVRPEVPVIVSGSSFPDTFDDVEPYGRRPVRERTLFAEVSRQNNNVNCLYGDWASVRPPIETNVPMTPVPRIDIATREDWSFFRFRPRDGGYKKAAEEAMQSSDWNDEVNVWGTYLIRATVAGDASEITYPGSATAARINMHIHNQVNFDDPIGFLDTEDDFLD